MDSFCFIPSLFNKFNFVRKEKEGTPVDITIDWGFSLSLSKNDLHKCPYNESFNISNTNTPPKKGPWLF